MVFDGIFRVCMLYLHFIHIIARTLYIFIRYCVCNRCGFALFALNWVVFHATYWGARAMGRMLVVICYDLGVTNAKGYVAYPTFCRTFDVLFLWVPRELFRPSAGFVSLYFLSLLIRRGSLALIAVIFSCYSCISKMVSPDRIWKPIPQVQRCARSQLNTDRAEALPPIASYPLLL